MVENMGTNVELKLTRCHFRWIEKIWSKNAQLSFRSRRTITFGILPVESFRVQNRGGKGLKGVTTKDEDFPKSILTCFSKDRLLIFTDQGRVYGLKAWETPQGQPLSRGSHIRNLIERIREDERVVTILPISKELQENPEGHYLIFATHEGIVKRSKLEEYTRINKNGSMR